MGEHKRGYPQCQNDTRLTWQVASAEYTQDDVHESNYKYAELQFETVDKFIDNSHLKKFKSVLVFRVLKIEHSDVAIYHDTNLLLFLCIEMNLIMCKLAQ